MSVLFLKLLNMSIVASWTILAVLVLRLLLKKAPKWIVCLMWAIVGIRLIVPVSFESVFSLLPTTEPIPQDILEQSEGAEHVSKEQGGMSFVSDGDGPVFYVSQEEIEGEVSFFETSREPSVILGTESNPQTEKPTEDITTRLLSLASVVWILGMIGMAIYAIYSYLRIYVRVRSSVLVDKNAYISDEIDTPFILGVFRPRIYMPSALRDEEQKHVLAHERAHLTRLDHIWKPLGYAVLTVYWFNPLIWLAYYLLCKDIEFACDERVIKKLDASEKVAYTTTLLQCSVPRKLITACPLAFGELKTKERIKTVLHYKKPAIWIMILALTACLIFSVAFLTDPKDSAYAGTTTSETQSETDASQNYDSENSIEPLQSNDESSIKPPENNDKDSLSQDDSTSATEEELSFDFCSINVSLGGLDRQVISDAAVLADCKYYNFREIGTHIPITIRFETYEQLCTFVDLVLQHTTSDGEILGSVGDTTERFDKAFFDKHSLLIVYTVAPQGGGSNTVDKVTRSDAVLTIEMTETLGMTDELSERFNCIAFSKEDIDGCDAFELQVSGRRMSAYQTATQQQIVLNDRDLAVYMTYSERENEEREFLMCLTSVDDVYALMEQLDPDSAFSSALGQYDERFFATNDLFLFYHAKSSDEDIWSVPPYLNGYISTEPNAQSDKADLEIEISLRQNGSSDQDGVPQLLLFGIEKHDWNNVTYKIIF